MLFESSWWKPPKWRFRKRPWETPHGLFLKLHNLSNRQDAKVAKTNKFDVFACGETTSGKLGVLGVLAVKNAAYVAIQEKTMEMPFGQQVHPWFVDLP